MFMRFWQPKYETMPGDEIKALQLKRLRYVLKNVYMSVPFYRREFDFRNIKPEDIQNVRHIDILPTTEKSDLRNNYSFSLFAVPMEKVVRLHASSGKPTVGYMWEK